MRKMNNKSTPLVTPDQIHASLLKSCSQNKTIPVVDSLRTIAEVSQKIQEIV